MAYIFHENELPSLISEVPGRKRIFFVNPELTKTDDRLAGVMPYEKGATAPCHLHKSWEHVYFIMDDGWQRRWQGLHQARQQELRGYQGRRRLS